MLNAKIREEADELCRAESKEEIASEAADLLYFAMVRTHPVHMREWLKLTIACLIHLQVRCMAAGVHLPDIAAVLDRRSLKVTRRPGHAKPAFVQAEASSSSSSPSVPAAAASETNGQASASEREAAMIAGTAATTKPLPAQQVAKPEPTAAVNGASTEEEKIVPLKFSLKGMDKTGRDALLQRPLASSQDMIARVQPIISTVRKEGDAGLRGFIKNFDRCSHVDDANWSHVITAPFPKELMQLSEETMRNIDVAFDNIRQFHQAQVRWSCAAARERLN